MSLDSSTVPVMRKMLAVSTGGGHWEQLVTIKNAFSGFDAVYANTIPGLAEKAGIENFYLIHDCNRRNVFGAVHCFLDAVKIVSTEKPKLVLSTGALPGLIFLLVAKIRGISCIWVDSVANAEKLSMSGHVASYFCDACISQWDHVAKKSGRRVSYIGSVL
jgi:UDP-N-acetylglucosamine:LPS N-acetylglucosamine transferase